MKTSLPVSFSAAAEFRLPIRHRPILMTRHCRVRRQNYARLIYVYGARRIVARRDSLSAIPRLPGVLFARRTR
jgi:hypothetical protein